MTERRTIEELITRYSLEPTLNDVYVEGHVDRAIFRWLLKHLQVEDAVIYDISDVEVPVSAIQGLKQSGYVGDNRNRVLAVACSFAAKLPCSSHRVCFVVDSDYDHCLPSLDFRAIPRSGCLIVLDFPGIETYLVDASVCEKFFSLVARCSPRPDQIEAFLSSSIEVCERMYAIRAANVALGWNIKWIDIDKFIDASNFTVIFDENTYIQRYLQAGRRWSERDKFQEEVARIQSLRSLMNDRRVQVRGHDFIEVLHCFLRRGKFSAAEDLKSADATARALSGCAEAHWLASAPAIAALVARLRG